MKDAVVVGGVGYTTESRDTKLINGTCGVKVLNTYKVRSLSIFAMTLWGGW